MSRIPHDATVAMNVRSLQNALRNIATLLPYDPPQAVQNLEMLADRVEEMWREEQARDDWRVESIGGGIEGTREEAQRWVAAWRDEYGDAYAIEVQRRRAASEWHDSTLDQLLAS